MRLRLVSAPLIAMASVPALGVCGGGEAPGHFQDVPGVSRIEEFLTSDDGSLGPELTDKTGPMLVGTRIERKIAVRNGGWGSVTCDSSIENEGLEPTSRYESQPLALEKGAREELMLPFEPTESGERTAVLSLGSVDDSVDHPDNVKGMGASGGCIIGRVSRLWRGRDWEARIPRLGLCSARRPSDAVPQHDAGGIARCAMLQIASLTPPWMMDRGPVPAPSTPMEHSIPRWAV